jgi:hypothetical protein
MASPLDKLNTEEVLVLQEMFGNHVLMNGLRKIFAAAERDKLDGMRSEALGQGRTAQIVQWASESRSYAEWETTLKRGMERLAPQGR